MVAFAALAGGVQLVVAVRPSAYLQGAWVIAVLLLASSLWAVVRSVPKRSVTREFTHPGFSVTVKVGDLFAEDVSLVIGFTDVYDTSLEAGVISPRSVQAQLLKEVYGGDARALDSDLEIALQRSRAQSIESELDKPLGKRVRYPIGTVAVVSRADRKIYCVAYSRMSNDLVARSSVDNLWRSLGELWSAIASHGQLGGVAMPILGSDLARIGNLGRESLLKVILLSFVARSREGVMARSLTVLIHPRDAEDIDMHDLQAFLASL
jgi:hypothetical protein